MKRFFSSLVIFITVLSHVAVTYASVTVTVNGTNYTIPQKNEKGWGDNVTSWIQAISANTVQPTGGTFLLSADLDFGANFGLKSLYYKTRSTNVASLGNFRLATTESIAWRNNANTGNLLLTTNASDQLLFNGSVITTPGAGIFSDTGFFLYNNSDNTKKVNSSISGATTSTTTTLTFAQTVNRTLTFPDATDTLLGKATTDTLTNKTIAAASNTITGLTNTNLSGSAAISNANLATMTANTVKANATGSTATPTDLSISSSAVTSTAMIRDSSANVGVNNLLEGYTTIATSAGTTTLTVGSTYSQFFTGTLTHTLVMPATNTLSLGQQFLIVNNSSGAVTVQNSALATISILQPNVQIVLTCIGTTPTSWTGTITPETAATVTSVAMSVPAFLSIAGSPITTSGTLALSLSGTALPLANGGTGQTTKAAAFDALSPMTTGGDLIYGGASGTGTRLANGTALQVLQSNGTTLAPSWRTITAPTVQVKTSGSGNYTTPANVLWIKVRMSGGGGGGAASVSAGGVASGNGGNSTWNSTTLVANGGTGANNSGGGGGAAGGTATVTTSGTVLQLMALTGSAGGGSNVPNGVSTYVTGGMGGANYLGGAGASGAAAAGGGSAPAFTGGGGGGGGSPATSGSSSGAGGGAGGYLEAILYPTASQVFAYVVGSGGAGETASGTGSTAGGAGGGGIITVEEYYQ